MTLRVETVTSDSFEQVLPLIEDYQRFYKATPNRERNIAHFSRYLHDHSEGILFVAIDNSDGAALGFATIYYMPSSVQARATAVFNDLYTVEGLRGRGVGIQLATRVFQYAKSKGYDHIGWHTQKENRKAQRLYDFTHADKSEWINYDLAL